jgi:hypothetical protein
MQYIIELTEAENKALSYVATNPQAWINNAIKSRCVNAVENIIPIVINKCIETNTQIPNNKDDMVLLAFEQGWVETAEAKEVKFLASLRT